MPNSARRPVAAPLRSTRPAFEDYDNDNMPETDNMTEMDMDFGSDIEDEGAESSGKYGLVHCPRTGHATRHSRTLSSYGMHAQFVTLCMYVVC